MSTTTTNNNNNAKTYLLSLQSNQNYMFLLIIDESTQELVYNFQIFTIPEMFEIILYYNSMVKAVFVNIDMLNFFDSEKSLEGYYSIKDFLHFHSIPSHFYASGTEMAFRVMVAANITPCINDFIFWANLEFDQIRWEFKEFTPGGYKSTTRNQCAKIDDLEGVAIGMAKIMKSNSMKKLILFTADERMNDAIRNFEKILRTNKTFDFNDKLIVIDCQKLGEVGNEAVLEMSKWFFDRSYNKFYVSPQIPYDIGIYTDIGDSRKLLVAVDCGDPIPCKKSIILDKIFHTFLMMSHYSEAEKTIQTLSLNQKCHQRQLTFTIESECVVELNVEPIIFPEIEELPKKLGELETKIPVIGFFQTSSAICVSGKNGYQFLDSWNGLYGNELFINFEEEKPKFGMSAIKVNKTKMSFVVYDLIKIMSMPADNITINESWKFTITKDSENPILIEFDNFDGTKKAASPSFLMAMLLKEKMKLIKKEMKMNEKPKETGFCFFDKMTDVEKKRIESELEEACEMLKIKCKFIALK